MRPTVVTVLGVLNIVFGGLGLLTSLVNLILPNTPLYRQLGKGNMAIDFMNRSEAFQSYMQVASILGVVGSVVLIVAGIGLLKMRPWSRPLSIAYAVFAIVSGIVGTVVTYQTVFVPMIEQAATPQERIIATSASIGGIGGGFAGLLYPVALIFLLLRKTVGAAFSQARAREPGAFLESGNPYQPPRA
jgi:hypothetical protein